MRSQPAIRSNLLPFFLFSSNETRSKQELSPKEAFLLEYILLIVQFRLEIMQGKKGVSPLLEAIETKERTGEKLGISGDYLRKINVFVRDTYRTERSLCDFQAKIYILLEKERGK